MPLPLAIPVAIKGGELLIIGGVAATGAFMTWWYGAGGKEQTQQAAGALANSISNSMSGADEEAGTKLETGAAADACTGDCKIPPKCKDITDEMRKTARVIQKRFEEMAADVFGMAGGAKIPKQGSLKGHIKAIKEAKAKLANDMKRANNKGCPIPNDVQQAFDRKT